MELPSIHNLEDDALNIVTTAINAANMNIQRLNLFQLVGNRNRLGNQAKLDLSSIVVPIPKTAEQLLGHAIEKTWKLTRTLMYHLEFNERTKDAVSDYYYFEAIFSQPTITYPIPQVTASVFFRVQQDHTVNHEKVNKAPIVMFRIEGQRRSHDVRYISLIPDDLLGVMKMKMKLFQRIEEEIIYF